MTDRQTEYAQHEIITAPSRRYPSGAIVTYWNGPAPSREPRAGREPEFRRAQRLMVVGIAQIRQKPERLGVARRCFHAATCLYAWALGADPRLAFAWDRIGYVHQRAGNDDEAESCYLRSLAVQNDSGEEATEWNEVTLLNLAIIYGRNGRPALNRAVLAGYDPSRRDRLLAATADTPGLAVRPEGSTRRRPRRGYTAHGLRLADVVAAFVRAEQELGTEWQLAGRGHCRRVVLDGRYSRVVTPVIRSWVRISPNGAASSRTLFPRVLVERAAEILGVEPAVIAGREY